MPRPISWLPRLHEIRRSVANSVRSHYDRRDLEQLFELQPRAAQKLIELLATVQVGTSHLVEREALGEFLDRVRDSKDTQALFEQIRSEKVSVSRRKVRSLVRRDMEPISLASLPSSISLSRGRLEVSFRTVEELAEAMYALARLLHCEGDEFVKRYEPTADVVPTQFDEDIKEMYLELEQLERARQDSTE
jgi:hypothetical protein